LGTGLLLTHQVFSDGVPHPPRGIQYTINVGTLSGRKGGERGFGVSTQPYTQSPEHFHSGPRPAASIEQNEQSSVKQT
jgi:hypothetical protein